jgi:hypothetical protein
VRTTIDKLIFPNAKWFRLLLLLLLWLLLLWIICQPFFSYYFHEFLSNGWIEKGKRVHVLAVGAIGWAIIATLYPFRIHSIERKWHIKYILNALPHKTHSVYLIEKNWLR